MTQPLAPAAAGNSGGHPPEGVLLLDKPSGISSSAAVQAVRRAFGGAKAGHTGTLDPMASGLLPVCLGEATKFSHLLLESDKAYTATIRLGITTSTGDLEGEITAQREVNVGRDEIERVLRDFRGEILQTPPMYSALKHGGRPLYQLARAGREVARSPRRIVIHELVPVRLDGEVLILSVTCSKGTYVRALAEDIGRALGCGACLAGLRRDAVGRHRLSGEAVTLDELVRLTAPQRAALLLPVDTLVSALPRVDLDAAEVARLSQGRPVERAPARASGLARLYGPDREFLGVGEIVVPGRIVPRRLRSQARAASFATGSIA